MNNVLIITAHVEGLERITLDSGNFDTVICADGGLDVAERIDISPDFLIGDYDSTHLPEDRKVIRLPMEKDMTDSEAAIDLAVSKGARSITVLGGLGGRFDHTMGNMGLLAKYCGKLDDLCFVDGYNRVFMLPPGRYEIPKNSYYYMGLIAYGGPVKELTLEGVKYPLSKHTLPIDTSLGVSNEIKGESATITFTQGRLLVIFSNDTSNKAYSKASGR